MALPLIWKCWCRFLSGCLRSNIPMPLRNTPGWQRSRVATLAPLVLCVLILSLGWDTMRASAQAPPTGLKITGILFEDFDGSLLPRFDMAAGGDVVLTFRVGGFPRGEGVGQSG